MLNFNGTLRENEAPEIGSLYAIYGKDINDEISVLIVGKSIPIGQQVPVISLGHQLHRAGVYDAKTPASLVADVFNIDPRDAHYVHSYDNFIVTFQTVEEEN